MKGRGYDTAQSALCSRKYVLLVPMDDGDRDPSLKGQARKGTKRNASCKLQTQHAADTRWIPHSTQHTEQHTHSAREIAEFPKKGKYVP